MKDREARFDIRVLEAKFDALTKAYDALFDVVAKDLGYQAKIDPYHIVFRLPETLSAKVSPRQFEMTTPSEPQLVRTITAIGKKVPK